MLIKYKSTFGFNHIDLKGAKYLIGSAFAFSLMSACVKSLDGRLPITELVFSRALISLLITRLTLSKKQISPWGINKKLLILRGIIGTGALFCIFKSIELLPLAHSTIIQYTYPTITSIIAWVFLKEKVNKSIFISLLLGWLGIVFVIQPEWLFNTPNQLPITSVVIALCGSILTSFAYLLVRKLSQSEHPLVIIHYFPLISLPLTIPFILYEGIMPKGIEWLTLIGIGIFTQIGQIGITKGLSLLPASRATAINYTQVLFASILGILIFSEQLNNYVIIGAIAILCATLISVGTKQKLKRV
tara:strand:+ start:72623 stop:73528 length:906 start_codon:yes stop_codon:yes gene_type:complete